MREISGALYHLDPIWFERLLGLFANSSFLFYNLTAMALLQTSSPEDSRNFPCFKPSLVLLELPLPLPTNDSGSVLARPKSQSFTSHLSLTRILAGFKSRCITFALWMNLRAQIKLYNIAYAWSSVNSTWDDLLRIYLRSFGKCSMTMKMPVESFFSWTTIRSKSLTVN